MGSGGKVKAGYFTPQLRKHAPRCSSLVTGSAAAAVAATAETYAAAAAPAAGSGGGGGRSRRSNASVPAAAAAAASALSSAAAANAERQRAFAVAAEVAGRTEEAATLYLAELRQWLSLLAASAGDDAADARCVALELARAGEGVTRCYAQSGVQEESVVRVNKQVLRCVSAALGDGHPVAAGVKVHLGDSYTVYAKTYEAQRIASLGDPDTMNYDQTETEAWRRRLLVLAEERDAVVREACGYYSQAVVSYRVCATLSKGEPGGGGGGGRRCEGVLRRGSGGGDSECDGDGESVAAAAAAAAEVAEERGADVDANGVFGSHVAHCLAKIAEGNLLCEQEERADDFRTRAENAYDVFAELHADDEAAAAAAAAMTQQQPQHQQQGGGGVGEEECEGRFATMPYCGGFEYDASAASSCDEAPQGSCARVRALVEKMGGRLDPQRLLLCYDTWVPSVLDIHDVLRTPESTQEHFDRACERAPTFLGYLAVGDPRWAVLIRELPLLAFVGSVAVDAGSPCADMASAVVLVESPFAETIMRHTQARLEAYPHLRLYSDLTEREVAKCHGHDWERTPFPFRLPLLQAIKGSCEAAITLLLDFGAHPLACSPHDMASALPAAMECASLKIMKALLQHPAVTLDSDEHACELRVERVGVKVESEVTLCPLSEGKRRSCGYQGRLPFASLWELVMSQPAEKAQEWYVRHSDMLLTTLDALDTPDPLVEEAFAGLFRPFLLSALTRSNALGLDAAVTPALIHMATPEQRLELACVTQDAALAVALFRHGVDINAVHLGMRVAAHHIKAGNTDVLRYISEQASFDEGLLTKEELVKLDVLVDRWGANLLS